MSEYITPLSFWQQYWGGGMKVVVSGGGIGRREEAWGKGGRYILGRGRRRSWLYIRLVLEYILDKV